MNRKIMKAAKYKKPYFIKLEEVPIPIVKEDDILIEVYESGICGGDLHRFKGIYKIPKYTDGHEFSGIVKDIGTDVKGIEVGEKVTVEAFNYCGQCSYCRQGLNHLCPEWTFLSEVGPGGYGEYALVKAKSIFKLPANMSFEKGALIEPLAVAVHSVRKTSISYPQEVLIIGGGTIGLCGILASKAFGVTPSILIKYIQQERIAKNFGAKNIFVVNKDEIPKDYFSAVIDTTASEQALKLAFIAIKKGGTICLLGSYTDSVNVEAGQIIDKEIKILGSLCYNHKGLFSDYEISAKLINESEEILQIITHKFQLKDINKAFKTAIDKSTGAIKVHLVIK
jgi:2-desacetyl-2-hydroxyethyl bacteriochlorophyllide A dehydrogenase